MACLLTPGSQGQRHKELRPVGTMTDELAALADWLTDAGCTQVALESTGVFWQPNWNLREGRFELFRVNARHSKAVPGRKAAVKDGEWIADLLQHGLLRGSAGPNRPRRARQALTRYRTALIRERATAVNRLQKTLAGATSKLSAVATDLRGQSSRALRAGLVDGTTDAAALAQLAHLDYLDDAIARLAGEIAERRRPLEPVLARLEALPGGGRRTAAVLLAASGWDLSRFPTASHLASWAGLGPGNHASAGKRRSGRMRPGNAWLRSALPAAGQAAGRTKPTV